MKKIKLALVGCGPRGIAVSQLFRKHPDCEITALMDPFEAQMDKAQKALELTDPGRYTDYDQLISDRAVDAVFIASDPLVQVAYACLAMEAGIHACTEVPAAFSIDECWKLVKTVEKTGAKYQLMEQTRYWGFVDAWKRLVENGDLGHVCLAQGEYIHYYPKRIWFDRKTGELIDELTVPEGRDVGKTWRYDILGEPIYYLPHTLSPLLKILDDRVVKVSCFGTRKESYTYPDEKVAIRDVQYALMHTAKDTVMIVGAGFSMPSVSRGQLANHWYELRGPKGSLCSPRFPEDAFRKWEKGASTYESMELSSVPIDATEEDRKAGHGGADYKPVKSFIDAIVNDTTPPMDVYLSVETAAPAILAVKADATGEVLTVPDFRVNQNG